MTAFGCPDARSPSRVDPGRAARAKKLPKPKDGHYPVHTSVTATVFWIGEPPTAENGCVPNYASAFDHDWVGSFGGCDSPVSRTMDGAFDRPAGFVPRENPYYFALPFGLEESAPWRDEIPWAERRPDAKSIRDAVKNRWIGVRREGRTCYAQWEDVGPFCADDVEYVFGDAAPRNDGKRCDTEAKKGDGTRSGLDMSPALSRCLEAAVDDTVEVDWWFVDDEDVPQGPWRRVVTNSPVREGKRRPRGACFEQRPFPACGYNP